MADTETTLGSLGGLDAALIDRNLPDGDELVSTVRSRFDAVTMVVTETSPDNSLVELPADDYLLKPVEEETLLKRLSLLEELDTTGVLQNYSDARKTSLLEYHIEAPERYVAEETDDSGETTHRDLTEALESEYN